VKLIAQDICGVTMAGPVRYADYRHRSSSLGRQSTVPSVLLQIAQTGHSLKSCGPAQLGRPGPGQAWTYFRPIGLGSSELGRVLGQTKATGTTGGSSTSARRLAAGVV